MDHSPNDSRRRLLKAFPGMAAPAMSTMTVGSKLVANYSDGSTQTFALKYEPFFMTGDMLPDGKGGTLAGANYKGRFGASVGYLTGLPVLG